MFCCMVDTWFGTCVGVVLMNNLVQVLVHGLCIVWYRFWCMVDARFGTCVGALLMHNLVQVLVHG
jgi:hypothetical protein